MSCVVPGVQPVRRLERIGREWLLQFSGSFSGRKKRLQNILYAFPNMQRPFISPCTFGPDWPTVAKTVAWRFPLK